LKVDEAYDSWKLFKEGVIKMGEDIDDFSLHLYFDLKYMLNFT